MSAKNKRAPVFLFIMGSIACCLLIWIGAGIYLELPELLADLGEPAADLDLIQRVYLTSYLLQNRERLDQPAGVGDTLINFDILEGETAASIVARLQVVGIAQDYELLLNYLRFMGIDRIIEVGRYPLSGAMTPREIAQNLQHAETVNYQVTIPEGWRMEQIAEAIAAVIPDLSEEELKLAMSSCSNEYEYCIQAAPGAGAEGALFPDTYRFEPDVLAEDIVNTMLDNFTARIDQEMVIAFGAQELSLYEAVILASIIEREAVVNDERAMIASVFLNRLALGMKLETDPTVQYALGQQGDGSWWKTNLLFSDLEVDSAYNTYVVSGLPPAPIANPGWESLNAVAHPIQSPFLYFRALCDGSGRHAFAETYEQHLLNACP